MHSFQQLTDLSLCAVLERRTMHTLHAQLLVEHLTLFKLLSLSEGHRINNIYGTWEWQQKLVVVPPVETAHSVGVAFQCCAHATIPCKLANALCSNKFAPAIWDLCWPSGRLSVTTPFCENAGTQQMACCCLSRACCFPLTAWHMLPRRVVYSFLSA